MSSIAATKDARVEQVPGVQVPARGFEEASRAAGQTPPARSAWVEAEEEVEALIAFWQLVVHVNQTQPAAVETPPSESETPFKLAEAA
ncbi:MAG TPA: hypothetical protein VKS60_11455 [Stellaceae bacterium]|nr:hypothetical protein [Stellaceae bacterium]